MSTHTHAFQSGSRVGLTFVVPRLPRQPLLHNTLIVGLVAPAHDASGCHGRSQCLPSFLQCCIASAKNPWTTCPTGTFDRVPGIAYSYAWRAEEACHAYMNAQSRVVMLTLGASRGATEGRPTAASGNHVSRLNHMEEGGQRLPGKDMGCVGAVL